MCSTNGNVARAAGVQTRMRIEEFPECCIVKRVEQVKKAVVIPQARGDCDLNQGSIQQGAQT